MVFSYFSLVSVLDSILAIDDHVSVKPSLSIQIFVFVFSNNNNNAREIVYE